MTTRVTARTTKIVALRLKVIKSTTRVAVMMARHNDWIVYSVKASLISRTINSAPVMNVVTIPYFD